MQRCLQCRLRQQMSLRHRRRRRLLPQASMRKRWSMRRICWSKGHRRSTAVKKLRRRAALAYRKIRRQASPRSLCMWATRKFRWGCFMTPRRRFSTARTMPAFWGSALISMLHRKFSTRRSIPGSAISSSASCMMQPRRLPACSTTPSALSLIMRAKIG